LKWWISASIDSPMMWRMWSRLLPMPSLPMASWLGQQELLAGRIRPVAEIVAAVDGVDQAAISRVAKRVLDQPIQLSVIGPFNSDAKFRSAIGL